MSKKKSSGGDKKDNKVLMIAVIVITALVVLFFVFRSFDKVGDSGIGELEEEIDAIDVGDNPDIGVEDFGSLEVSQEEVASN